MIALEVRFLTGRYTGSAFNDRTVAEWPPHPARVYSALVAALHDEAPPFPDEGAALDWLATLGPPEILASDVSHRAMSAVYVATNDASALASMDAHLQRLGDAEAELATATLEGPPKVVAKAQKALDKAREKLVSASEGSATDDGRGTAKSGREALPAGRSRQPRNFPTAVPEDPVVHLCWSDAPTPGVAAALDRVCARVARLGHSSSMVSVRVCDPPDAGPTRHRWVPDELGAPLRVPAYGQRARLEAAHERHQQVEARVLPASFVRYARAGQVPEPEPLSSTFSDAWIAFEVVAPSGGRRVLVDLSLAQAITRALRGCMLKGASDLGLRWPESLSGHEDSGAPSSRPHLAFLPLADVGHPHATGSVLGVALVPPRDLSSEDRTMLARTIAGLERAAGGDEPALKLWFGRAGETMIRRLVLPSSRSTLRAETWSRPSRTWHTATGLALSRNPGNLRSRDPAVVRQSVDEAARSIAEDCVRIGLPSPVHVEVHPRSWLVGAPEARRFMPFPSQGSGPRRVCVHAEIQFDCEVGGPVILGAGRYFGLGLCRPVEGT